MAYLADAASGIWVLGETRANGMLSGAVFELSAKAVELSTALAEVTGEKESVSVILLLDAENAGPVDLGEIGGYGPERIILVKRRHLPFDRGASGKILAHLIEEYRPKILLAPATAFGRSVMPYAAALVGAGLTADCTGLSIEEQSGLLLQTRPAIGGNIMATIKTPDHMPQMATVRPKTFATPKAKPGRGVEVVKPNVPSELLKPTVETLSFEPFASGGENMQEQEVIVAGGKGLRRASGFELLSSLASLLGAAVGASRPVVEMKWIGYPHQIGLSGQTVSPKVYIAAGISGSVQHLAGMQTSGKIISINRDPDAQIFNVSDVAICGDLYEVIPLLIDRIRKRKEGTK